ncbi:YVTN family beta-propeller repeat protein [Streptomyces coelicoflavus]|uniref:YVTN family beta-propeller repeat protein n=1 Tax=Streptomyces coelicoflavus TaxID=285562 RepID=UPI0036CB2709
MDDHGTHRRPDQAVAAGAACRVDLTHRVLGHVPVGAGPEAIAVDARFRRAFVACSRDNAVTAVDLDHRTIAWRADVGREPIPIVFDPPTRRLFTADARSNTVTVLDGDTGARLAQLRVGDYPAGLGHDVARRRVFTGDTAGATITAIDADRLEVIGTVPAELGAGSVAVDRASGRAYCVNFMSASVTVFDTGTLQPLDRIPVGEGPCKAELVPGGETLYVAESLPGTLARGVRLLDGHVTDRAVAERAPVGLHAAADGRWLYVRNRGAGTVGAHDARTGREQHRITVGKSPGDCVIDPTTGRLLVSNAGSGTLTVVDRPWLPNARPRAPHPATGRRLPDFSLPDLRGGRIRTTREWAERKYVINFFASW